MGDLIFWCENLSSSAEKSRREIKKLLRSGVEINQRNRSGRTPLMIVCWVYQEEDITSLLQLFLDYNANVHLTDNFGWNALHFICRFHYTSGLVPAIRLLLECGIHVQAETRNENCALHLLCQFNNGDQLQKAVEMLVVHGMNSNSELGRALHLLCRYNHQCKNFEDIFHFLIDRGATVSSKSSNRKSLLHSICRYTYDLNMVNLVERVVTELQKCQTTQTSLSNFVDCRDIYGNTATLYAAQGGCIKTVRFLMKFSRLDAHDGFNKNAVSYLLDIVRFQSFSLCTCCRNEQIDVNSKLLDDISLGEKVTYTFKPINLSKLAETIPESIDRGFTNNPKPSQLNIPDIEAWDALLRQWRSNTALKLSAATTFLDTYGHQQHTDDAFCSWCTVSTRVEKYIQLLMDKAAEMDPRFDGEQFHYGSSAERTKILSPDEFDFMLVLRHFTESNVHIYHNNYDIVGDCPSDEFKSNDGYISSARLLHYYYQLLLNAVHRVESFHLIYQDASYGETCVTLHLLYRDKLPLLKLTVDITVAVARVTPDSTKGNVWPNVTYQEYLVPYRNLTGTETCRWKPSFSSMERDIMRSVDYNVSRCYSLLKLCVILAQCTNDRLFPTKKTKPSSYAIKTCLLEHLKAHPPPWKEADFGEHILSICRIFLNKHRSNLYCFFNPKMPVYEIGEKCRKVMMIVHERVFTSTSRFKPALTIAPSTPTSGTDDRLQPVSTPSTAYAPTRPLPTAPQLCCCCILKDLCAIM